MSHSSQNDKPTGTRKVKYTAGSEWDFAAETTHQPIDLSLVLPHYRARHQPVNHRMSMFLGSDTAPIRAKVVSACALINPIHRLIYAYVTVPPISAL
jgi:hypothetical protein